MGFDGGGIFIGASRMPLDSTERTTLTCPGGKNCPSPSGAAPPSCGAPFTNMEMTGGDFESAFFACARILTGIGSCAGTLWGLGGEFAAGTATTSGEAGKPALSGASRIARPNMPAMPSVEAPNADTGAGNSGFAGGAVRGGPPPGEGPAGSDPRGDASKSGITIGSPPSCRDVQPGGGGFDSDGSAFLAATTAPLAPIMPGGGAFVSAGAPVAAPAATPRPAPGAKLEASM
mmetsp:Transcript_52640/g.171139  ORF Transcript_52640/g.171139 Transcript_52640/m.171139 type:complete len:232 (+) Transcript_52640:1500-2195(+)